MYEIAHAQLRDKELRGPIELCTKYVNYFRITFNIYSSPADNDPFLSEFCKSCHKQFFFRHVDPQETF